MNPWRLPTLSGRSGFEAWKSVGADEPRDVLPYLGDDCQGT